MEAILSTVDTISVLFPPFLDAAFAVVAFASVITAITPTPRDDEFVGKLYKALEWLALNFGHAKEIAPNRVGGRFVAG